MPQRPGFRQFSGQLSEEAYRRLQHFTTETGTSMVAFLEALSLELDPEHQPRWLQSVVMAARRVEAAKRRRARPPRDE